MACTERRTWWRWISSCGAETPEGYLTRHAVGSQAWTPTPSQKTPMSTETLYDLGWRQGSVLQTPISTVSLVSGPKSGTVKESVQSHELWAVVTQECGLARARVTQNTPSVELRQVHDTAPPITWGIRTRKFLLSETPSHYLIDDKPIAFVSPRLLSDAEVVKRLYTLEDRRVLALKTWLGNRYDRPAVPDELGPLAKAIADAVGNENRQPIGRMARDVYMQIDGEADARTFSLFAVTTDDADPDAVRPTVGDLSLRGPAASGHSERNRSRYRIGGLSQPRGNCILRGP